MLVGSFIRQVKKDVRKATAPAFKGATTANFNIVATKINSITAPMANITFNF